MGFNHETWRLNCFFQQNDDLSINDGGLVIKQGDLIYPTKMVS